MAIPTAVTYGNNTKSTLRTITWKGSTEEKINPSAIGEMAATIPYGTRKDGSS